MKDDRERWNAKHAAGHHAGEEPVALLREHVGELRRGTALDVACGTGRHALFLAERGFDVLAVDVSDVGLAALAERAATRGLVVRTERRDVTRDGLPPGRFDLVVVTYFLERALYGSIRDATLPGGAVLFETHTVAAAEASGGRFRREYCLEPGELAREFAGWRAVATHEGADFEGVLAVKP